ncbi:TetR/AcrR family transcriptional regulator [Novosphingobium sp.]|uniref:TetR/AcrR family transcriptional regulator n=1 Tax=Novosphingobium sp. TaxID=1874826 RepID=UPI001DC607ED|nr:TetR/AcrR family transcriptional regulator [Novosphingobium sp.]MBX9665119.1 TetR/AcrR family transcriptional regulator [Novosphingobium sp.]
MSRAEQKAATREKILDLAAERLRREGLAGNAVHRLMRDAGLTHGGFYVHFESKEALDIAALERAMESLGNLASKVPADLPRAERRAQMAARYLSRSHRDHPETGCPLAALVSEVPRGGDMFREAYAGAVAGALMGRQEVLGPTPPGEDIALLALMMGGLTLARAIPDKDLSDAVLRACRDASALLAEAYEHRRGDEA